MESMIDQAIQAQSERSGRKPGELDKEIESLLSSHKTRIKVVGCGGAGNNTLTRLLEVGVAGVVAVAINTDAQDLLYAQADEKILIGRDITNGLGAGSNPEIGEKSALESEKEISEQLQNSDLIFVTCGLGGGTGTGSAPVVAEIARKLGALTIAVVTLPFTEEGVMRWENARQGLERLREHSDTVIVVQNDRLLEIAPDMPLNQAFKVADEILANAVKGVSELVTEKGLVNLDFADIRAIMKDGGTAMIGLGESNSEDKAIEAVEMAVQNPLLDVDITGAKSALINITGGNDMSLKDARIIMKAIAERLDPAARVIWGARMDPAMDQTLRVMLIVTGLKEQTAGGPAAGRPLSFTAEAKPHFAAAPSEQPDETSLRPADHSREGGIAQRQALASENPHEENREEADDRPVFKKIFEEETEADLRILDEAVNRLEIEANNQDILRDIRNAASALNNTAQVFAFNHISAFAEAVENLANALQKGEIELTTEIIELLKDGVVVFQGLVYEDPEATAEAKKLIEKVGQILANETLEEPAHRADETLSVTGVTQETSSEARDADSFLLQEEEGGEESPGTREKVGDMVNYVRNLLGENREEADE